MNNKIKEYIQLLLNCINHMNHNAGLCTINDLILEEFSKHYSEEHDYIYNKLIELLYAYNLNSTDYIWYNNSNKKHMNKEQWYEPRIKFLKDLIKELN